MAIRNIESIRRMIARLRADPEFQAMLARNTFVVAGTVEMILNLNSPSQHRRHDITCQWCETYATGRWRRCIRERKGFAVLDAVIFEFENPADAPVLRRWLKARGW